MQQFLPWILASISVALALAAVGLLTMRRRARGAWALPTTWALTARPVFNGSERRLYLLLREALPQQLILAKLPLVRFCQPTDPQQVRFWFGLLGNSHVSFAVCSHNGCVLAALDLEGERPPTQRLITIKQSTLGAAGIRYLRCTAGRMPSVPELQRLLPSPTMANAGLGAAVDASTARRERKMLWQESGFMKDSFYGMDVLGDLSSADGRRPVLRPERSLGKLPPDSDGLGGGVIDTPSSRLRH
jgi:hypothetical protein